MKRPFIVLFLMTGCGAEIADEETAAKADLVGVWETTAANGEARRLSFANDKALVVATRTPGQANGQRVGSVTVCSDTDYTIEGTVVVTDVRVGARTRRPFELTEGGTKLKIDYAEAAYVRIADPDAKPITCSNVFPPDPAVR